MGHGGDWGRFLLLLLGATFLYLAGMFLNDAFDAHFDRQHRPERPIPSGAITVSSVWQWGLSWLGLGLLCFSLMGLPALVWALLLAGCILLYDAIHKIFFLSPVLMAGCRLFLMLAAASVSDRGITGYALWAALMLASYIVGLSYLARRESVPSPLDHWPCVFLAGPILLALVTYRGPHLAWGLCLSALLLLWILYSIRHIYWSRQPNIGRSVAALLAGIPLTDLLAVGAGSLPAAVIFLVLFGLALFFQRFIPAT
jgi:4-hydroxybenzoate polyprenyltransferase